MVNLITDPELREVTILIYAMQVSDILQEEGQTTSPTDVAAAVAALREDNDVIRAPRLRNVQVAGRISDLELTIQTLVLTGLFSDRETPP
jgi:hypothetical protein